MTACGFGDNGREQWCRDGVAATHLKWVSIGIILFTSAVGISSPVVLARLFEGKPAYANALLLIKCFAAGVILSTSLVHVLPDAFDALADCQLASRHPWRDFPFSGFVALVGALLALLVDVSATSHASTAASKQHYTPIGLEEAGAKGGGKVQPEAAVGMGGCHGDHGGHQDLEEQGDQEQRLAKLKQRMVLQVLEIGIVFHSVIVGVTLGMS